MKKIGLVTFFRSNYGSALQCYATKVFLEKKGYETVLIEKTPWGEDEEDIEYNKQRHPEFFEDFQKFMKSLTGNNAIVSSKSMDLIDTFVNDVLCPQKYTLGELREIAAGDEFDAFVVGSDQVWNCTLGMLSPLYFLLFAPEKKRITLCPSFGANNVPVYLRDDLRDVLNTYRDLSAREEEGVAIIKDITGREAKRLPDPTLLLTDEEWRTFSKENVKEPDPGEDYILLHFLNEPNEVAISSIRKLIKETGKSVKCFATRYEVFENLEGLELLDGGPADYITSIDKAGLVLTDSFHTTMFSINLESNFYTFDRQYVHGVSQISRITTALKRYGLMDRLILEAEDMKRMDDSIVVQFENSKEKIKERESIQNYLMGALGDK